MEQSRAINGHANRILGEVWGAASDLIEVRVVHGPGGGSINRTFALDVPDQGRHFLRIAPSDADLADAPGWVTRFGLRREAEAIRLLSANAELASALPETVARGVDDGADWVIQRVVRGFQASTLDREVRPEVSDPVWRACGDLVGMIHAVQGEWFGPVSDGERHGRWIDLVRADGDGLVADARRLGLDEAVFEGLRERIETRAVALGEVNRPTLIHSDLSLDHVFLEDAGEGEYRVTGVIDLEFARFVDSDCEKLFSAMLWRGNYELLTVDVVRWCIGLYDDAADRVRVTLYAAIALGWNATLAAWLGDEDEARRLTKVIGDLVSVNG